MKTPSRSSAVKLADLQAQVADLDNKWKRALADYQNLQKRTQTERTAFVKLANFSLFASLLPAIDDLERAAAHLNDPGLNLVIKQFHSLFDQEGLVAFNPIKQPFNHQTMECVDQVPGPNQQVIRVILKGYRLGETVLRPAKVVVGNGQSQTAKK